MITVEQLQKGCLGTGRSLDATHGQVLNFPLNPLEVKHEILHPQSTALANGRQLSRLVVGEAKRRQVAVLGSELTEDANGLDKLALNELESIADLDNVSVVSNVARGGTKMDDGHGRRGSLSVGMDVAHDIVTELLLLLGGILKVDIVQLGTHLLELLIADLNAKLLLGGGKSSPKLAPRSELHGRRPHKGHLFGGISLDERMLVLLLARESSFGELSVGQLDKLVSVAHGLSMLVVGWQSSVLVFFGAVGGSGTVALIVNSRLYK